jgi:hypothetical protein
MIKHLSLHIEICLPHFLKHLLILHRQLPDLLLVVRFYLDHLGQLVLILLPPQFRFCLLLLSHLGQLLVVNQKHRVLFYHAIHTIIVDH